MPNHVPNSYEGRKHPQSQDDDADWNQYGFEWLAGLPEMGQNFDDAAGRLCVDLVQGPTYSLIKRGTWSCATRWPATVAVLLALLQDGNSAPVR